MDEYVVLKDGVQILNAKCRASEGHLFIYCDDMDIQACVNAFYGNTETVEAHSYGDVQTYTGYTVLYSATAKDGKCNIGLKKGW